MQRPAIIERLDSTATHLRTPCGDGDMQWRCWGHGPALVLLHGGFGSWMHWVRNIEPLGERFRVLAADMPGLGESDAAPEPVSAEAIGAIVAAGVDDILGDEPFNLAGFSFGGLIGGQVVKLFGAQAKTFILVGASGLRLTRPPMQLMRRTDAMSEAEREAAYVHNAMTLMLHDKANLDALGLYIHKTNDSNARVRSRRMSLGDSLLRALPDIEARIGGIWGEYDATAVGHMDERPELLRSVQPAAPFTLIEDAGHWVQYEQSRAFNAALLETIASLSD